MTYSFIIPHHNSPELLKRCIDSIPQRDDVEVIVVDDNSESGKRAESDREDVKIVFVDAEQTKGAGRARNIGIENAHGRWLLFADCDDFYEKNFLSVLDDYANSTYDIIYFDAYHGMSLETGKCNVSPVAVPIERFIQDPKKEINIKALKHSSNDPWNKMFSREFICRIEDRFDEVPATNDAWFCHFAATKTNNIHAIPKKLYYWIQNPNSITTAKRSWAFEKQRAQTSARVHHLTASDGAWYTLPYPWKGFRWIWKRNGLLFAIRLQLYKMSIDVNPLKVLYYKYKYQ